MYLSKSIAVPRDAKQACYSMNHAGGEVRCPLLHESITSSRSTYVRRESCPPRARAPSSAFTRVLESLALIITPVAGDKLCGGVWWVLASVGEKTTPAPEFIFRVKTGVRYLGKPRQVGE